MRKFQPELKAYLRDVLLSTRQSLDLTQEQMAAKLHMSPRSYCDLERGVTGFSAVSLVFLLNAVSPDMALHILQAFPDFTQELEQKEAG